MSGGDGNECGAAEVNNEPLGILLGTGDLVPDRLSAIGTFSSATSSKFSCDDDDSDTFCADTSASAPPDSFSFACSILDGIDDEDDDDDDEDNC